MGKVEYILVLNDVKEQRDLATGMIMTLNYNEASVSIGEKAIAYLQELMVLDMIMGLGMDRLDTYRGILEIHPKQKAIIVSGFRSRIG
jgi:two-component system cell cycle sensor histidine kinase/response regulator CckA